MHLNTARKSLRIVHLRRVWQRGRNLTVIVRLVCPKSPQHMHAQCQLTGLVRSSKCHPTVVLKQLNQHPCARRNSDVGVLCRVAA
jgi:hypothetical protein